MWTMGTSRVVCVSGREEYRGLCERVQVYTALRAVSHTCSRWTNVTLKDSIEL